MDKTAITSAVAGAALVFGVPGLASAQQSGQQGTTQQYGQQSGQQQPQQQQQRWQQYGQQQPGQQYGQQQRGMTQQQFGQRQQLEGEGAPLYASPGEVMQAQRQLSQLGFDVGAQDGQWGSQTQQAIEQFQQQRGLSPTGNLNLATMSALGIQIGRDGTSTMAGMGGGMMQQQRGMTQQQLGQRTQQPTQRFGQQRPGQGQQSQQQQQFGQSQQLQGEGAQLFASPNDVRQVEQRLSQMGFDPGEVDGRWNEQTASAIEQFQQQRGLSETGNLNFTTLSALGVQIGQEGQYLGIGSQQQGTGMQQQPGQMDQSGQQQWRQGQQSGSSQGLSDFQSGQQQDN